MGSVNADVQLMSCLGKHGAYTFYKSIKLREKTFSLTSFLPVRIWPDSELLSLAEIQLLWTDKSESFASLRLYFLPENTPMGRKSGHGEDELIALQEKVIIRAGDLLTWLVDECDWDWGFLTPATVSSKSPCTTISKAFFSEKFQKNDRIMDMSDLGCSSKSSLIVVLNYERYVRVRTVFKRLENSPDLNNWISHPLVLALGGLNFGPNTRLLFAKESFEYPELEDHELLCNHLAPKLKGRPRKKKRKRNPSLGSESNVSESSSTGSCDSDKNKKFQPINGLNIHSKVEKPLSPLAIINEIMVKQENTSYIDSPLKNGESNAMNISKPTDQKSPTTNIHLGTKKALLQRSASPKTKTEAPNSQSTTATTAVATTTTTKNEDKSPKTEEPVEECKPDEVKPEKEGGKLLGLELSEIAQKLEKSNALQILPIRPSVIKTPENSSENHSSRTHPYIHSKKFKTEISQAGSEFRDVPSVTPPMVPLQQSAINSNKSFRPSSGQGKVMGPPNLEKPLAEKSGVIKVTAGHLKSYPWDGKEQQLTDHRLEAPIISTMRFNKPLKPDNKAVLSITPIDLDAKTQQQVTQLNFGRIFSVSPSPFLATSQFYGDPSISKGKSKNRPPLQETEARQILDFSMKKPRLDSTLNASSRPSKTNTNPLATMDSSELLDLSIKSHSEANKNVFHISDIPPPNNMSQQGFHLTKEVTLFPSNPPTTGSSISRNSSVGINSHKMNEKSVVQQHQQHHQPAKIVSSYPSHLPVSNRPSSRNPSHPNLNVTTNHHHNANSSSGSGGSSSIAGHMGSNHHEYKLNDNGSWKGGWKPPELSGSARTNKNNQIVSTSSRHGQQNKEGLPLPINSSNSHHNHNSTSSSNKGSHHHNPHQNTQSSISLNNSTTSHSHSPHQHHNHNSSSGSKLIIQNNFDRVKTSPSSWNSHSAPSNSNHHHQIHQPEVTIRPSSNSIKEVNTMGKERERERERDRMNTLARNSQRIREDEKILANNHHLLSQLPPGYGHYGAKIDPSQFFLPPYFLPPPGLLGFPPPPGLSQFQMYNGLLQQQGMPQQFPNWPHHNSNKDLNGPSPK